MATVVVGYVPKPEGEAALRRGMQEAGRRGDDLVVVDSRRARPDGPGDDAGSALHDLVEGSGLHVDVRQVPEGREAAEEIVDAAGPADLIVIGLRRRSPLGKLILGSSAQRILLDARCAVLAVKP